MVIGRTDIETKIPIMKKVNRPWGLYEMFCENKNCTVKILNIKRNQMLSLQFHNVRDQVYYIIDPFTVYLSDEPVPKEIELDTLLLRNWAKNHMVRHECEPGNIIYIPTRVIHRPCYEGNKEIGRIVDLAFGHNSELDIVRIEDKYGRV